MTTLGEFYKIQLAAIHKVQQAKYRGKLKTLSKEYVQCTDCRNQAVFYDHRDYRQPLNVQPVCQKCNQRRGRAKW